MTERTELPQAEPRPGRCCTCRFWEPNVFNGIANAPGTDQEDEEDRGECHRHAPLPTRRQGSDLGPPDDITWPTTLASDWCGEWQPAKAKPDAPAADPFAVGVKWREFLRSLDRRAERGLSRCQVDSWERLQSLPVDDFLDVSQIGVGSVRLVVEKAKQHYGKIPNPTWQAYQ